MQHPQGADLVIAEYDELCMPHPIQARVGRAQPDEFVAVAGTVLSTATWRTLIASEVVQP